MNDIVRVGPQIPGIRYREYFTDRAVFLLPCFPQTADEEDLTERFLKRDGYVLARWKSYVITFWISCITTVPYEIGEIVVFAEMQERSDEPVGAATHEAAGVVVPRDDSRINIPTSTAGRK